MRNLAQLTRAVQRNCDISDARFAGDYGLCTFLLKMREYYRWNNDLAFSQALPRSELADWLSVREQAWEQIAAAEFESLPLICGAADPFDADCANRELLPQGYVYSAGYGRRLKPLFFLGRLLRAEERAGFRILIASRELARELAAPPAMLQGRTVYVRLESARRFIWEKLDEARGRRQGHAMARALASYDFAANSETALQRMAETEIESMILHELGEARAGEMLGDGWDALLLAVSGTRGEPVARAIRDLLADCLSTLPGLLEPANLPALHFHFANFDAPRRQLFPQLLQAYERFLDCGDLDRLRHVAQEGAEVWLATARSLLDAATADRQGTLENLLEAAGR